MTQLSESGDEVSPNAIEVYVHRLRKKLEPGRIASPRCAASATAWKEPNQYNSRLPQYAPQGQVAQLVEQRTENPCVGGSIPSLATNTSYFFACRCVAGRVCS